MIRFVCHKILKACGFHIPNKAYISSRKKKRMINTEIMLTIMYYFGMIGICWYNPIDIWWVFVIWIISCLLPFFESGKRLVEGTSIEDKKHQRKKKEEKKRQKGHFHSKFYYRIIFVQVIDIVACVGLYFIHMQLVVVPDAYIFIMKGIMTIALLGCVVQVVILRLCELYNATDCY